MLEFLHDKPWYAYRTQRVYHLISHCNFLTLPFHPGGFLLPRVAATVLFYRILVYFFFRRLLLFQNHPT